MRTGVGRTRAARSPLKVGHGHPAPSGCDLYGAAPADGLPDRRTDYPEDRATRRREIAGRVLRGVMRSRKGARGEGGGPKVGPSRRRGAGTRNGENVDLQLMLVIAGLFIGVVVGLTGMGGGALMTPVLVIFFGVPPLAAVSSDLVVSAVMKPVGGLVHLRRGTVDLRLVGLLCLGSVPSAFCGVLVSRALGNDTSVQEWTKLALGVALLLAATGLIAKAYLALVARGRRAARPAGRPAGGACSRAVVPDRRSPAPGSHPARRCDRWTDRRDDVGGVRLADHHRAARPLSEAQRGRPGGHRPRPGGAAGGFGRAGAPAVRRLPVRPDRLAPGRLLTRGVPRRPTVVQGPRGPGAPRARSGAPGLGSEAAGPERRDDGLDLGRRRGRGTSRVDGRTGSSRLAGPRAHVVAGHRATVHLSHCFVSHCFVVNWSTPNFGARDLRRDPFVIRPGRLRSLATRARRPPGNPSPGDLPRHPPNSACPVVTRGNRGPTAPLG